MKSLLALGLLILSSSSAIAQDRNGGNTAGDWKVTHFKSYGLWDSACDEREEAEGLKQRCYLRYVEGYSPHPKFLASFVFVHPQEGASVVELGVERGTQFDQDGFRSELNGTITWSTNADCLNQSECRFFGSDAETILAAWKQGGVLVQDFADRYGDERSLNWDLSGFDDAFADYAAQAEARSLLN